jgi:hypothetical protein
VREFGYARLALMWVSYCLWLIVSALERMLSHLKYRLWTVLDVSLGGQYIIKVLRPNSHGVSCLIHVSKPKQGDKAPTFEPQETIKTWLILIKVGPWLFHAKNSWGLCWELSLACCSTALSTKFPSITSKKCCDLKDRVQSGKSQLSMFSTTELAWIDLKWLGT